MNESSGFNDIKHEVDYDVDNQFYVTIERRIIKGRYRHPINHSAKGKTEKGASIQQDSYAILIGLWAPIFNRSRNLQVGKCLSARFGP